MAQQTLNELYEIIKNRKAQPKEGSYTNYLFDKGLDKILKKVGEEATEVVIAAKGLLARLRIAQKLQTYNVYPVMSSDI